VSVCRWSAGGRPVVVGPGRLLSHRSSSSGACQSPSDRTNGRGPASSHLLESPCPTDRPEDWPAGSPPKCCADNHYSTPATRATRATAASDQWSPTRSVRHLGHHVPPCDVTSRARRLHWTATDRFMIYSSLFAVCGSNDTILLNSFFKPHRNVLELCNLQVLYWHFCSIFLCIQYVRLKIMYCPDKT